MTATIRTTSLVVALGLLAACTGEDTKPAMSTQDVVQAVRGFVEVRELEELDLIATHSRDSWHSIDDYFLIYEGRRAKYLVDFGRRCHELSDNRRIVPDERWDSNKVRARFDTIRGCRIIKIYALTEAEAAELESIGEAPGSRN